MRRTCFSVILSEAIAEHPEHSEGRIWCGDFVILNAVKDLMLVFKD